MRATQLAGHARGGGAVAGRPAQPVGPRVWPDDISLLDPDHVDASRLLSSAQVTDSYLLALAGAHRGRLASFDRRLVKDAVRGGARRLHLIE